MNAMNTSMLDAYGQPKTEFVKRALERVEKCLLDDVGPIELADAVNELQALYFAKTTWYGGEDHRVLFSLWRMRDTLATLYPTAYPTASWHKNPRVNLLIEG